MRPAHGSPNQGDRSGGASKAFRALDAAEVRWCVLRGDAQANQPDIDLLIPPDDMPRAERTLTEAGFIEQPAPGYRPHRFFWHVGPGDTTKLDVVTDLRFGPGGRVRLPGVNGIAGRRRRSGNVWRPDEGDEFWTLLLHAMLDKPTLEERHRTALVRLAPKAMGSPAVDRLFTGRTQAEAVVEAVETGRWSAVADWVKTLAPGDAAGHEMVRALTRRVGWRTRPLGRRGVTVALLAPDGAGKTTVTELLAKTFPIPVRRIYMGLYKNPRRLPPGLGLASRASLQWIRYALAVYHRARGRVVLFDRYTDDAALPGTTAAGARERFRRRVLAGALPRPDLVIALDAPAEELLRRKGEHDVERLEAARRHYRAAAEAAPHGAVLDATRPAETVAAEAAALIWRALGMRS